MIIDGQKYACDACIRGHRVSHCQHQDRELHKVAPKGRPVSQCAHCRGARKVRAQHVACNCAEKGHSEEDCPQRKGEKGEPHTCCCSHGARCGCSLKKDHRKEPHLDTVPEDDMCEIPTPDSFDIKPARSNISTPSESKMTVFANGHHKPVHKHNDAAHRIGLPYTIPRTHSIHGHSDLAQRSVDSLPATNRRSLNSSESSQHQDAVTSAPQPVRRAKSQPGSPGLRPRADLAPISTASPALDSTYSPFGTFSGTNSPLTSSFYFNLPDQTSDSYFGYQSNSENIDGSLPSAGLNAPPSVDWSSLGIQPYDNTNDFGTAASQPPSYASFDYSHDYSHVSHPGLTSSSGEISEPEDFPVVSESTNYAGIAMPADTSKYDENNFTDNTDSYRLSSASSMGFPAGSTTLSMLKRDNVEELDIDDFLRQADEQTQEIKRRQHASSISSNFNGMSINNNNNLPTPPRSVPTPPSKPLPQQQQQQQQQQQTPVHGLTVREAQNYAHQSGTGSETSLADSIHHAPKPQDQFTRQISNSSGLDDDPMLTGSGSNMNSPEEVRCWN